MPWSLLQMWLALPHCNWIDWVTYCVHWSLNLDWHRDLRLFTVEEMASCLFIEVFELFFGGWVGSASGNRL